MQDVQVTIRISSEMRKAIALKVKKELSLNLSSFTKLMYQLYLDNRFSIDAFQGASAQPNEAQISQILNKKIF